MTEPGRADTGPEPAPDAANGGSGFREDLQAALRQRVAGSIPDGPVTARGVMVAVGGIRGVLETVVPGLAFITVFTALLTAAPGSTQERLLVAIAVSVALSLAFLIVRIVQRQRVSSAVTGFIGVAASAALTLWTREARDNFLLGLIINAGYALALLVTVVMRWPLVGLVVGFLDGRGTAWRQDRRTFLVAQWLTLGWCGLFVLRLAVEVPFYLANNTVALGVTRLLLGLPLFALLILLTWIVANAVFRAEPDADEA